MHELTESISHMGDAEKLKPAPLALNCFGTFRDFNSSFRECKIY
jgi:hypothetical protein